MYIYLYQKVYKFNKNGFTFEIEQDIRTKRKTFYKTYISEMTGSTIRVKIGLLVENKEGGISLIKNKSITKFDNKQKLFDSL